MTLKRALLPLAALTLAAACSETPGAPTAATADGISQVQLDPPPPPITGRLLYDGTGDGEPVEAAALAGVAAGEVTAFKRGDNARRECDLVTFCLPARYFQNNPLQNEWLDVEAEEPLPEDIKRQLETVGAACGVTTTDFTNDIVIGDGGTIFCPVSSFGAGKIVVKHGETDGVGLAYDVSEDGLTATTVSLDQLDAFFGKGFVCSDLRGATVCTTPPVFGDVWAGTVGDDGQITYVRVARVLSPFRYVENTPLPPIEVEP